MSERVKGRKVITYFYNDLEQLISQVETTSEPLDEGTSEFSGVVGTLSLAHGALPPASTEEWAVYKIYEKAVIWVRRQAKEATPLE